MSGSFDWSSNRFGPNVGGRSLRTAWSRSGAFTTAAIALVLCLPARAQSQPASNPSRRPPRLASPTPGADGSPGGAARVEGALRGLTADELARFVAGRDAFEEVEDVADGLGPVFNDVSCATCHSSPAVGGGSDRLVTRFGTVTGGVFDPMADLGGSLMQSQGIGPVDSCDYTSEVVPEEATIVAHRRTPPLFGLGLVDAVPDARFEHIAARQSRRTPDTAGRINYVTSAVTGEPVVGKFGWKAQVGSLLDFSGDAYLNEMGITNPLFPDENCPQGDCSALACDPVADPEDDGGDVEAFADFMAMLAPPPPGRSGTGAQGGELVFQTIGCESCHLSEMRTGRNRVQALDRVTFHPYSDFLLHDMGSLGDGIEQGDASGSEMRTAPLWGLRAMTTFLHDGSASTIEDAILAHDGQGQESRDRYTLLSPEERQQLLDFLNGL